MRKVVMRTEIKQDYAKPYWHREQSKLRKFINGWGGFILFIIFITLAGAEWK